MINLRVGQAGRRRGRRRLLWLQMLSHRRTIDNLIVRGVTGRRGSVAAPGRPPGLTDRESGFEKREGDPGRGRPRHPELVVLDIAPDRPAAVAFDMHGNMSARSMRHAPP